MQLGLILPYQNNEKGKYLDIGYKEMVKLEEFIDGFLSGNITNYLKQRGSLVFKCE